MKRRALPAVAANVRAELARQGMSQRALADILGKSQTYIYRRLNGETPFTIDDLALIAGHLEIPLAALIADSSPAAPKSVAS
ncbi:helix-turn-helix domain-containing protein [Brevibacterium casei]|uniref:Helix-turn-helix transcriptional regulator n=1 Tax=Brevibacterium casei TaxID=33889 RepID=A0A7T2TGD4_9MICO|nr:helix-turn-helix transcriptional regulator [Brevibacterium casei]QPS33423.1 helix-turn-helix transcriptional regulator [Brevibacterium casei]